MKISIFFLISILSFSYTFGQGETKTNVTQNRILSTIDSTYNNEIVLIREFTVNVPIDSVWNTYTTKEGWESAFVAIAEIDFKINRTIKTSYDKNATIGDSTTIVNNIINYVPKKNIDASSRDFRKFP